MFTLIEFLRYDEDANSYIYKLIDTDFECEIGYALALVSMVGVLAIPAAPVALEYKKRNCSHDEIVKNLFKLNLYLCNKHKHSFENTLDRQHQYLDKYFKHLNFNENFYQDLKDMWDKHKAFI